MLLFWTRLLSFRVPRLEALMVLLPKPMPAMVVVLALPVMFRFSSVLLVAGSAVPIVWPQMTALVVLTLVLAMVRSRVVPPAVLDPSMVTQSAPLRRNIDVGVAASGLMLTAVAGAGLIVTVFTALAPGFALNVIGNVSPVVLSTPAPVV